MYTPDDYNDMFADACIDKAIDICELAFPELMKTNPEKYDRFVSGIAQTIYEQGGLND
tara:strand:+ start:2242 stop:2415 length:174 start_codon:yes stop_codon:yes gene_type:complete